MAAPDNPKPRLAGRIALITGASRGIGAAVARRFAAEGARLILVARSTGGLEAVDDAIRGDCGEVAAPTLVPLDLSRPADVDRLAAAIAERFGRLDILVGNAAALGTLTPVADIEPEEWDRVMALNLTANWRLARAFDAPLRASDAGRAIFVTSTVAQQPAAYWAGYAVSKAALECLARTWAAETEKTNLRINVVNPGRLRTAMRAEAFPGEDPEMLDMPDAVTDLFVDLAEPACRRHGEIVRRRG